MEIICDARFLAALSFAAWCVGWGGEGKGADVRNSKGSCAEASSQDHLLEVLGAVDDLELGLNLLLESRAPDFVGRLGFGGDGGW